MIMPLWPPMPMKAWLMIEDASKDERDILSSFSFSDNHVILHSDSNLMPKRRAAWAAWNYLENRDETLAVTYWMNRLQSLRPAIPAFCDA